MAKAVLNNLTSNYGSQALHNANSATIEDHLNNKVLYRDNPDGEPNQMESDLDMNSQRILNLLDGTTLQEPATIRQLNNAISDSLFNGEVADAIAAAVDASVLAAVTEVATGYVVQKVETQTGFTASQTVVTLSSITYVPGVNNVVVVRNGLQLTSGTDYTEDSTTQLTMVVPLDSTDMLIIRANDTTSNSVTDSSAVSHTSGGTSTALATYLEARKVDLEAQAISTGITHNDGIGNVALNTHLDSEAAKVASLQSSNTTGWSSDPASPSPMGMTGVVVAYAGTTAPVGWLLCNGAIVSRDSYSDLFAAIGTAYGIGNGATTFGIPDLRGEFIRGFDSGRGVDTSRVLGSTQTDSLKSHSHHSGHQRVTSVLRGGSGADASAPDDDFSSSDKTQTQATGGTETRPRNIAMNYIIKI